MGVALAMLALGCAGSRARTGAPLTSEELQQLAPFDWVTWSTPGFVVHTDLDRLRARDGVVQLEQARAGLLWWLGARAEEAAGVEAVVFAQRDDNERTLRSRGGAYLLPSNGNAAIMIVGPAGNADRLEQVYLSGLAHQLLRSKYRGLPGWLEQGVIAYLGTARVRGQELSFAGPADTLAGVPPSRLLPATELIDTPESGRAAAQEVAATSFAMVRHLLDEQDFGPEARPRFLEWLRLVAEDRSPPGVRAAFVRVYGESALAAADHKLLGQLRQLAVMENPQTLAMPAPPADVRPTAVALSPERRDTIIAGFQRLTPAGRAQQKQERAFEAWVEGRRNQLRVDLHPIAPHRLWTLGYGRMFSRYTGGEVELGVSPFGPTVAARYRGELRLPHGTFAAAGVGPFLALRNQTFGLGEPNNSIAGSSETSFHHYGVNPELAAGKLFAGGLMLRVTAGMVMKLSTNMNEMCGQHSRFREDDACYQSFFFGPVGELAARSRFLYFRLGAGYVW